MSQNAIAALVALALIGACAWFALSAATTDRSEPEATASPDPAHEPEDIREPETTTPDAVVLEAAEPEAAAPEAAVPEDAGLEAAAPDPAPARNVKREARRERRIARRAVLEQRAATRRAERAAYAQKRAAERAGHRLRPLAELDPFGSANASAEPVVSSNGDGHARADGLGPAVAFDVEPRETRDAVGPLGPAIAVAPAPVAPSPTAGSQAIEAVATATKPRPRIFTGEPVPLEPRQHATKRAIRLFAGMTALAAGGAIGILAVARAIAAMFGR